MAKVIGVLKTIRNNWKKSVFFTAVVSYGASYANDKYDEHMFMTECCKTVALFGDKPISVEQKPKKVTVILNPAANKRNAKSDYEKYCAPLLHLAGYSVTVLSTEREGGARSLVENLIGETDALIVAGGDGTVSEVVTGLLRRLKGDTSHTEHLPIGILPLGRTNNVARRLLKPDDDNQVHFLAHAAMTIIKETSSAQPVVKIENLQTQNPEKCVYALNSIEWGAMREAKMSRDHYWYFGQFRDLAAYVFGKKFLNDIVDAELEYSPPCSGCSNCYKRISHSNKESSGLFSWLSWAFSFNKKTGGVDYSKITNLECSNYSKVPINTLNINIDLDAEDKPILRINVAPQQLSYAEFIKSGYMKFRGEPSEIQNSVIEAKDVTVTPHNIEENKWLSIDNEDYEVKPMKLTLVPNAVYLFQPDHLENKKQSETNSDQTPKLYLNRFNTQVGIKQFI